MCEIYGFHHPYVTDGGQYIRRYINPDSSLRIIFPFTRKYRRRIEFVTCGLSVFSRGLCDLFKGECKIRCDTYFIYC